MLLLNDIARILFSLIRYEIFNQELENASLVLDEGMLEKLYTVSKMHDIVQIVADALYKAQLLDMHTPIAKKCTDTQMLAAYRYTKLAYDSQQIFKTLEQNKIPFIPLKGAVMRSYYPEPYLRTSCDVDILIHSEDCQKALDVLSEQLGFTCLPGVTLHDYQLKTPSGVHVELHYALIEDDRMPKVSAILKTVWDSSMPVGASLYRRKMSDEMFVFYHIAHMAKHFLGGGCGIRTFIDLWLIQNRMPFQPDVLNALLADAGLLKFYNECIALCGVWFDGQSHTQVTQNIENFVLKGGVYGTMENHAAVAAGKGESKLVSICKIIFLPRKSLEILYPRLKKHWFLLPYYQIKRWFGFFNKKRREHALHLSDTIATVSKEKELQTRELLSELDLSESM